MYYNNTNIIYYFLSQYQGTFYYYKYPQYVFIKIIIYVRHYLVFQYLKYFINIHLDNTLFT